MKKWLVLVDQDSRFGGGRSVSKRRVQPDGVVVATPALDQGLYGEVPESLAGYIDYKAVTNDLGMEYTQATIAGKNLVYACQ